jgi:hypothetical protein
VGHRIGLRKELRVGWQIRIIQTGFARDDYDLDRWPPMPDGMSEFQPIHSSRHIDVSEYQGDIRSTFQCLDGLIRISRLDGNKPSIFYKLDRD